MTHDDYLDENAATSGRRTRALGHYYTLRDYFGWALRSRNRVPAQTWFVDVPDPKLGTVRVFGDLREEPKAETAVVLVHGLGGNPTSGYLDRALAFLHGAFKEPPHSQPEFPGWTTLNLGLRGAGDSGEDLYHCGQTADLEAALASPELAKYANLLVMGFSMGGHLALHLARKQFPRLRAVAAINAPINLVAAEQHIDSPSALIYRRALLRALTSMFRAVSERGRHDTPWADVEGVRKIRDWDRITVCPRYGYDDPIEYYRDVSVYRWLGELQIPSLLLEAPGDPMVAEPTVRPFLDAGLKPGSLLDVRWARRGGHLGFPKGIDFDLGPHPGLVPQVVSWFREALAPFGGV